MLSGFSRPLALGPVLLPPYGAQRAAGGRPVMKARRNFRCESAALAGPEGSASASSERPLRGSGENGLRDAAITIGDNQAPLFVGRIFRKFFACSATFLVSKFSQISHKHFFHRSIFLFKIPDMMIL